MRARLAFAPIFGLITLVLGPAQSPGQENPGKPPLPPEVSSWLERDQIRRWANLLEIGERKFNEGSCAKCHGEGGKAGRFGPDLTDGEWVQSKGDLAGIWETIFWGVRRRDLHDQSRRFEMNPAGGMDLQPEELDALTVYVWSLSHGRFLPERSR